MEDVIRVASNSFGAGVGVKSKISQKQQLWVAGPDVGRRMTEL